MFKLTHDHVYWWPVEVKVPDPNRPGRTMRQAFEMLFEAVPPAELERLDGESADAPPRGRLDGERRLLARVCRDWRNVVGPDDQPLTFTPEALDAAIGQPWFRLAVMTAYARSLTGEEARLGN